MISRPRELHVLHVLSSQYHIGPKVYGTFENGRVEEHFDSTALTPPEMRDLQVSSWIGARMAELHQVDIGTVEGSTEWEIEGGMFPGAGVDLYLRKIGKETDDVKQHGRSLKVIIPYFEAT